MWNMTPASKICLERDMLNNHQKHIKQIVFAKPMIDMREPFKPSFLRNRSHHKKVVAERNNKIQYENQLLLNKMMNIEVRPGNLNKKVLSQTYRQNHLHGNTIQRINTLKTINGQNQRIMKRLKSAHPTYSKDQWQRDQFSIEQLRQNILKNARRNIHIDYADPRNFRSTGNLNVERDFYQGLYTRKGSSTIDPKTLDTQSVDMQGSKRFRPLSSQVYLRQQQRDTLTRPQTA